MIVSIGIGFHAGTDRRLSAGSCYGGPGFRRSVEARVSGWSRLKRGLIGLGRPCPLCFRRRGRWEPHAPPRVAWVNTGAMTDSVALLSVPSRSLLGPFSVPSRSPPWWLLLGRTRRCQRLDWICGLHSALGN